MDSFLLDEHGMEFSIDNVSLLVIDSHGITGAYFITLHNIPNIDCTSDLSDYNFTFSPDGSKHASD